MDYTQDKGTVSLDTEQNASETYPSLIENTPPYYALCYIMKL